MTLRLYCESYGILALFSPTWTLQMQARPLPIHQKNCDSEWRCLVLTSTQLTIRKVEWLSTGKENKSISSFLYKYLTLKLSGSCFSHWHTMSTWIRKLFLTQTTPEFLSNPPNLPPLFWDIKCSNSLEVGFSHRIKSLARKCVQMWLKLSMVKNSAVSSLSLFLPTDWMERNTKISKKQTRSWK